MNQNPMALMGLTASLLLTAGAAVSVHAFTGHMTQQNQQSQQYQHSPQQQTDQQLQQRKYTWEDQQKIEQVLEALKPYRNESSSELMIRVAKMFLGTPYVAGTLEHEPEQLVVNVLETDCILFVEMCTCFVKTLQHAAPSFETYCRQLQQLRYENGVINGYGSRLHYTSAWILQNQANQILEEITATLPGASEKSQRFSFMTDNAERYAQLKDPVALEQIRAMEERLNQEDYYWLSPQAVADGVKAVKSGDIVCFVDKREGLDIAHVGIAYEHNAQMHFIHASYGGKAVIIEPKTLASYAKNGLRVCRLLSGKQPTF